MYAWGMKTQTTIATTVSLLITTGVLGQNSGFLQDLLLEDAPQLAPRVRSIAVLTDDVIHVLGTEIRIPCEEISTFEWSADGKGFFAAQGGMLLWLPIEGGEAKVLTDGWDWVRSPKSSPDGKRVLFVTYKRGSGRRLHVLDLKDGAQPRELVGGHEPAWGPQGKSVLFEEYTHNGPRMYQFNLASNEPKLYTPHPIFDRERLHDIESAPDGKLQIVSSPKGLHLFGMPGGQVRRLTDDRFYEDQVSFSNDQTRILFRQRRVDPKLGRVDPRIVEFDLVTEETKIIADGIKQAAYAPPTFMRPGQDGC